MVQTVNGFMDEATCLAVRRAMDAGSKEAAEVLTEGIELQESVRRAVNVDVDQATLDLVERRLDAWRPHAAELFAMTVRAREGASFLRYQSGGFYRPHRDRAHLPSWPGASRRRIAVVVFLNSCRQVDGAAGFVGGALRLFTEEDEEDSFVDIQPRAGTLVAFPATLLHEVTLVQSGTRDAIVDWFY